jgi:hypothetical protein
VSINLFFLFREHKPKLAGVSMLTMPKTRIFDRDRVPVTVQKAMKQARSFEQQLQGEPYYNLPHWTREDDIHIRAIAEKHSQARPGHSRCVPRQAWVDACEADTFGTRTPEQAWRRYQYLRSVAKQEENADELLVGPAAPAGWTPAVDASILAIAEDHSQARCVPTQAWVDACAAGTLGIKTPEEAQRRYQYLREKKKSTLRSVARQEENAVELLVGPATSSWPKKKRKILKDKTNVLNDKTNVLNDKIL